MSNERREAHIVSVIAAGVVSKSLDKPGTWDFQEAFGPYLELMEINIRADENGRSQNSATAHLGKQLALFHRGLELQKEKRELYEKYPGLRVE